MSISSVTSAGRASAPTTEPPATGPTTPPPSAKLGGLVEIDDTTHQPVPPRFPWLSRLSAQLESVARQKSPFTAAPMLGDNVDQAV